MVRPIASASCDLDRRVRPVQPPFALGHECVAQVREVGCPHIPKVLDLVGSGRCDPMLVSPSVVPWEEATEALLQPLAKCIVVRERIT